MRRWEADIKQYAASKDLTFRVAKANADAVGKLVTGFDVSTLGGGPVLVATVVNVNDMSRAAPLGRTLSEQYASVMSAKGFNHVRSRNNRSLK